MAGALTTAGVIAGMSAMAAGAAGAASALGAGAERQAATAARQPAATVNQCELFTAMRGW